MSRILTRWPLLLALLFCAEASATVYEVGPARAYSTIGSVPWESLQPGDMVLIYWQPNAYREKWVICRQGTAASPIVVRGVPGPNGELPVIDGNGATTRTQLNFWNQVRGLLKIGGANVPADTMPQYITIENLDLRSARPPYTFTAADGSTQSYVNNAAAVYIEKGQHIVIRNCIVHDSGNGLFVSAGGAPWTQDILIEGNYIYDNGNVGSMYEHNNYSEALGITFQYNRFGPTKTGADGNNLKDRSAGLVVRYNWIEGGNRQLDLVDSDYFSANLGYRTTFVYGNILIEPAGAGNRQIAHYGGDSGITSQYRKGTLYFYNNTVVSTRTDRTTLLRLSTNEERADYRNNIVYVTAAGNTVSLVDQSGILDFSHNWMKPGYVSTFGTLDGTIHDDGTSILGTSPGFVDAAAQDFHLALGSAAIDAGMALPSAVLPANGVYREYVKHLSSEARPSIGALDLGAFGYSTAPASLPFGSFDTPANNSTGVAGSIPVTGWALDSAGVAKVDIWREPNSGEPVQSNEFVYVGDAVFVSGARPDVAAAYPTYPFKDRAGWGYLMLTNMLPSNNGTAGTGNGTYRLHAIAHNLGGGSTDLGTRTITCDNAHAAKPFGAIDTPAQGETISGSAYVNFGWALTPQPAVIPVDGSTIQVFIDGTPSGTVTYNNPRSDVDTLFPAYANTGGAIGYFTLDTTKLADGMHSIAWSVTDSLGRTDGIGSRYFFVLNNPQ
jgi:hypothetical protein